MQLAYAIRRSQRNGFKKRVHTCVSFLSSVKQMLADACALKRDDTILEDSQATILRLTGDAIILLDDSIILKSERNVCVRRTCVMNFSI